jgi:hypothetical protein
MEEKEFCNRPAQHGDGSGLLDRDARGFIWPQSAAPTIAKTFQRPNKLHILEKPS